MNLSSFQAAIQGLQAVNQVGATAAGYISGRQTSKALKEYSSSLREESLREGRALLGAQRAAFAKSGVDPGTGTALTIQTRQRQINQYAAGQAGYPAEIYRFRLNQESALSTATGLASAASMLGKGVLDYYQNQPRRAAPPTLKGAVDYNPRRIGTRIDPYRA